MFRLILSCFLAVNAPVVIPSLDRALEDLDAVMLQEPGITSRKEAELDSLRRCFYHIADQGERFRTCDALFEAYLKWNADSAFVYAHREETLARAMKDPVCLNQALINLSRTYIMSGMYHEALRTIEGIDETVELSAGQPPVSRLLYDVYHSLAQNPVDKQLSDEYHSAELLVRERYKESFTPDMLAYYTTRADDYMRSGRSSEAQELLLERLSAPDNSMADFSGLYYWLGKVYLSQGDEQTAMSCFAISAQYDFLQPIREYSSAVRVAQYCYQKGDFQRAYRYITRCFSDARTCNAQLRLSQIAQFMPAIVEMYEGQESNRRQQLVGLVAGLSLVLMVLVVVLVLLRRNHHRLKKSNRLKNVYLGEFLAMFAEHINSLEKYRLGLRKVARKNDFDALVDAIRSYKYVEEEWDYLMDKFDKTVLRLFPQFIPQLNSLLQQEKHFGEGLMEGRLNNQLRCYALIRLGITQSARIAKFLRLSSSTVYNYRIAFRNAAVGNREDAEDRLRSFDE